jgi:hypothetical protein
VEADGVPGLAEAAGDEAEQVRRELAHDIAPPFSELPVLDVGHVTLHNDGAGTRQGVQQNLKLSFILWRI